MARSLVVLASLALAAPVGAADDLQALLDRASDAAALFAEAFKNTLATEDYRQTARTGEVGRAVVRVTRADVLVMKVAGPVPWVTFRDVFEADGRPVGNREERLTRLLRDDPASAIPAGRALLEEGARYNLGPVHRTLNVPTLGLSFLERENRLRFSFRLGRHRTLDGVDAVEVVFEERTRPTLIRDDSGSDVACRGQLWISVGDGALLRSEIEYAHPASEDSGGVSGRVVTVYGREPRLGMLVPVEMEERYEVEPSQGSRRSRPPVRPGSASPEDQTDSQTIRIQATARYSSYHRFEVQTEEGLRTVVPPPEP